MSYSWLPTTTWALAENERPSTKSNGRMVSIFFIQFYYFSNMLCSASLHTELCTQTLITPLYIFYYILQQKNFLFHLSAPHHCLRTRSKLLQTRIESKKGLFKDLFYSLTTPETDNRKIRICTLFWNHNILSIYDLNNHHNFKY